MSAGERSPLTIDIVGEKVMARRLQRFSASVQGAVMRPIVEAAGNRVRDMARALAPQRTGALRAGIVTRLLKFGQGYCHYKVTTEPQVYYGKFHEFGLGDKKEGSISRRTMRRREAAAESLRVKRRIEIAQARGGLTFEDAIAGLSKGEGRRQKTLQKGKLLAGMRRPNMAPHPFLRPAVRFLRDALRGWMVDELWQSVKRWEAPPAEQVGRGA